MHGHWTCELLTAHLDNDHHWDGFAFEDDDLLYLINAHETMHRVEQSSPDTDTAEEAKRI